MQSKLNPYINFRDKTREALEFYKTIFGGKLDLHTFKEFNASPDPTEDNKIMHGVLEADNGITVMAADTPNSMEHTHGNNMSMSLSGENESELRGYWDKLSAGGTVLMPLEKAAWGDFFGMCIDQFGVRWMVNITMPKTA